MTLSEKHLIIGKKTFRESQINDIKNNAMPCICFQIKKLSKIIQKRKKR